MTDKQKLFDITRPTLQALATSIKSPFLGELRAFDFNYKMAEALDQHGIIKLYLRIDPDEHQHNRDCCCEDWAVKITTAGRFLLAVTPAPKP